MDMITILKIVVDVFIGLIGLLIIIKSFKSGALKGMIALLIMLVLSAGLMWATSWMIDQSFKKAALTKFSNRFLFREEKLALKGCVKNIGKYKINHVYLHVKIINNAAGGSAQTQNGGRENTMKYSATVAKNVSKGAQKCFSVQFKYPSYFKLANIQKHISWD